MAERLAVDVSRTYETEWLGKRGDDKFPCTGAKITRVEFHKEVGPHGYLKISRGDAHTNDTELPDIGVHYWLEAGTKLHYVLRVWVED
jgi:hypothetical protein